MKLDVVERTVSRHDAKRLHVCLHGESWPLAIPLRTDEWASAAGRATPGRKSYIK